MNRALLFICFVCITATLRAQSLNGKIYMGIGDEPLSGVAVRIKGFTQTRTDDFGEFTIRLPGKEKGSLVNLGLIKNGFAVINREILKPRIPANNEEVLDIYMCPASDRDKLALQHYKIKLDQRIERNFKAEAKILADRLEFEKIGELTQKKKQAEKMLDSLAARLAKFDPEFASREHTLAMQLFESGKLEEAFKLIDPEKIMERIQRRNDRIASLEEANQQDIRSLIKAGDMAISHLDFKRADLYYKSATDSDTTNFETLRLYTDFLFDQNESQGLLQYTKVYVRHAKDSLQKGIALIRLGDAYNLQRQAEKAISHYEKALKLLKIHAEDKETRFLGVAFANMANAFEKLYKYREAIQNYESAISIYQNPILNFDNKSQEGLAVAKANIGVIYLNEQEPDKAVTFLEEAKALLEGLMKIDKKKFINYYPSTVNNLGNAYQKQTKAEKAIENYELAIETYKEIKDKNPGKYEDEYSRSLLNLGIVYADMEKYDVALGLYEESLTIRENLAQQNPERYNEALADVLNVLGMVHEDMYRYERALSYNERAIQIKRELAKRSPKQYEASLAKTLSNTSYLIGTLGNFPRSKEIEKEAFQIKLRLAKRDSLLFADDLGRTCFRLGMLEVYGLNFEKARSYFRMADSSYSLLPQTQEIVKLKENALNALAFIKQPEARFTSLHQKAFIFTKVPMTDSAHVYFKKAIDELEELPEAVILETSTYTSFLSYRMAINTSNTQEDKFELRESYISFLKSLQKAAPSEQILRNELGKAYSDFSRDCLWLKRFQKAEEYAEEARDIDKDNQLAISNLASALLFQGKYKQARKIYIQWKDEIFTGDEYESLKDLFLTDFTEFEQAGMTHPDIVKIRSLLQKE